MLIDVAEAAGMTRPAVSGRLLKLRHRIPPYRGRRCPVNDSLGPSAFNPDCYLEYVQVRQLLGRALQSLLHDAEINQDVFHTLRLLHTTSTLTSPL